MAQVIKKATRESFGMALCELAKTNKDIIVFDADLAAATKTGIFKKEFPERFFDCGIAEGNMVGVAAGMAAAGKIPVAASLQCSQQAEHLSRFATRLLTLILMLKLPAVTQAFQQVKTVLLISVLKTSVLCVQFRVWLFLTLPIITK